jgi:hypothetical protein
MLRAFMRKPLYGLLFSVLVLRLLPFAYLGGGVGGGGGCRSGRGKWQLCSLASVELFLYAL